MIASLRGRLVAGVLALAAAGMLLVGGITYATQHSSLVSRVDDQLAAATPRAGGRSWPANSYGDGDDMHPHGGRGGPPPGGRRAAGHLRRDPRQQRQHRPAAATSCRRTGQTIPALPADLTPGTAQTAGDYRVLATPPGQRLHAGRRGLRWPPPTQSLHSLLLDEALVIGGVLVLLGVFAWGIVRVGLLPLDRMGHTAAAIAGGDLSHRVATTDPRTEVGRLGIALNRMLDRLEAAFARARGVAGAAAAVHRRRVARAAHAAGVDPRLRGAVPDGRGALGRGRREGDAADRGRGGADGRARRGPPDPGAAGRGARGRARAVGSRRAGPRRGGRRARDRAGPDDLAERRRRPR